MKTPEIEGYLFPTKTKQIVFSQLRWPQDRCMCKSDRDYKRGVEVWKKSFINVLHARPSKHPGGYFISITNPKDTSMLLEYGGRCLVSLKPKGVLVLCIKFMSSWTKGYGVFADIPEKAIKLYYEYVEWLKLYHKNPKLFPPAKFNEH